MVRNFLNRNDSANVRCALIRQSLENDLTEELNTIRGVANGNIKKSDIWVEGV